MSWHCQCDGKHQFDAYHMVKCVLFAQVSKTDSARHFLQGKLTKTKRASVMTALFSEFDDRYQIYEDTDDMALFFE